jgi:hypothetical protein
MSLEPDKTTIIILYVIISVFTLFIIGLIIITVYISVTYVSPEKIPKITGQFGVNTFQQTSIVSECGESKKEICTFSDVSDINDAITRCNSDPVNCQAFSYSSLSKRVNFVNPKTSTGGNENVYIRQFPIEVNYKN